MRKAARLTGSALLVIAGAVLVGTLIPRPLWRAVRRDQPTQRILVLENPIHTDIAIPITPDIKARFAFLAEHGVLIAYPDAVWLIVGWGGRAFYLETPTWADVKPAPVLKALTQDRSVMHVDVAGVILEPQPNVSGFPISEAGLMRLTDYVLASFDAPGGAPVVVPGATYAGTDRFFEAKGRFNAVVGCNTWTARGLREAGLRTGWWNPLPASLSASLRLYN